jgi:hypothetical protein
MKDLIVGPASYEDHLRSDFEYRLIDDGGIGKRVVLIGRQAKPKARRSKPGIHHRKKTRTLWTPESGVPTFDPAEVVDPMLIPPWEGPA